MLRTESIKASLLAAFNPQEIDVLDESAQHAGHSGWREGGGTHVRVRMRAESLRDLSRVAQHRAVTAALSAEFASGLHALALDLGAPVRGPLVPASPD